MLNDELATSMLSRHVDVEPAMFNVELARQHWASSLELARRACCIDAELAASMLSLPW